MSSKTVIESSTDSDKTVIEGSPKTVLEGTSPKQNNNLTLSTFKSYTIIEQFPTSGSEADIYLVQKDNQKYVLKLYRYGIEPKREVVEKLKFLSEHYPKDIVKIYEIEYEATLRRWYEIQEYIEHGSLEDLKKNQLSLDELKLILVEITRMLHTIHSQNIIHRDLKPDNLLIRHKEPLQLVMTDFGISSVLDSELSKRMTSKSGTKVYFAPESFSGVIGKEVDYWALGMILLELASGENIFKELDENYIAYTVAIKNIPIPKDMNSDFAYLLKGLLTRDPENRWGYEEIVRWLKGDRDIALEYHSSEGEYEKPYVINGKKYYDLGELVALFATSPQMWQEGKAHLYRGYITKWCENNNDFDRSIKIDELKKSKDDDFALFKLIYTYNHDLDFIIGGKLINSKNLMLFMGKYLSEECNAMEENIVHLALTGKILDYYAIYTDSTQKEDDFGKILKSIITYYKDNHIYAMERIKDIVQFLKVASDKDQYYFSYDILMAHESLLIRREDFDPVNAHFTLPQEIIEMVQGGKFNRKYIKLLRKLLAFEYDAYYLPIDFNEQLQKDFETTVEALQHFIPKELIDEKLNTSFVPDFFKTIIKSSKTNEYLEYTKLLTELETLTKSKYSKLQTRYYVPTIHTDITQEEFPTFAKQIGLINDLIIEGLLIEKEGFQTLKSLIPQDIQKRVEVGKYDHKIAQSIKKLETFDRDTYILPDKFMTQIKEHFFKVTDNLDKCLKRADYERYFVSNALKFPLLKSSFASYITVSQLINATRMTQDRLEALQKEQNFLEAIKLNLDDLHAIDEKSLNLIKQIEDAKVDKQAYIQMMAIYDRVMNSKFQKLKNYFQRLRSLNVQWNSSDSKIIDYIYNYKLTVRTTYEHNSHRTLSRFSLMLSKVAGAIAVFLMGSYNIESDIVYYTVLAIYAPIVLSVLLNHEDIAFIKAYTHPFDIVLDNIDRNEEFSRRVDWVVR